MGTMASKSPASRLITQPFIQAYIKENIKAPRHWPLCGEFTGEFPAQMASNAENVFIWWRLHVILTYRPGRYCSHLKKGTISISQVAAVHFNVGYP